MISEEEEFTTYDLLAIANLSLKTKSNPAKVIDNHKQPLHHAL